MRTQVGASEGGHVDRAGDGPIGIILISTGSRSARTSRPRRLQDASRRPQGVETLADGHQSYTRVDDIRVLAMT